MAISKNENKKIALFGAIAGVITPFLLDWIVMPILNFLGGIVPEVSLKLASTDPGVISVNVRESLSGLNGGLAGWLVDAIGLTRTIPGSTYILGALGGALLMLAGAWVADQMNLLKGKPIQKTRTVILLGNIVAGIVVGWSTLQAPEIGIDMANVVIMFLVNAALLAYVYVAIDKQLKLKLLPF